MKRKYYYLILLALEFILAIMGVSLVETDILAVRLIIIIFFLFSGHGLVVRYLGEEEKNRFR